MHATTPTQSSDNRRTLTVDSTRHKRLKLAAVNRGITTRELVEGIIDHTLPMVESGEIEFQRQESDSQTGE